MYRALIEADGAAGAAVVVELVAVPDPEFDHRVLGARAEAAVAFEAVTARQATPRLVGRLLGGQPADDLVETRDALGRLEFGLLTPRGVTEIPQVQRVERRRRVFRRGVCRSCCATRRRCGVPPFSRGRHRL